MIRRTRSPSKACRSLCRSPRSGRCPLSDVLDTNTKSGSAAAMVSMLTSSNVPPSGMLSYCGNISSKSGEDLAGDGATTTRSAPPSTLIVWRAPPMQVMPMRSILSGTATSRPFASVTAAGRSAVLASAADASSGFCPCPSSASPPCVQPPKATVPVVATPAATSSSTNLLLVMFSVGALMSSPLLSGRCPPQAWSPRSPRSRCGNLRHRSPPTCPPSGFPHPRCGWRPRA